MQETKSVVKLTGAPLERDANNIKIYSYFLSHSYSDIARSFSFPGGRNGQH